MLDDIGGAPAPDDTRTISDEMRASFGAYGMSVIVSRALPDVRDGLKPVHRRIMYCMMDQGYISSKSHKKSARVVGEVMGKYHPHGDSAIYEALVRLAQDFSLRAPLVDGQGNFGSVDGDPAAAMRYTESRLSKVAEFGLCQDLALDTVDYQPNYDGQDHEPRVMPSRFPNLLVNGGTGIAVGMASNIPTHNLGEVIDATLALIDDPNLAVDDLMKIIPGPDFPTAGLIHGRGGIRQAYLTGRGSVRMGEVSRIETVKGRERIIITEIPYGVVKQSLVEKIGSLVNEKVIEGVSDVRDESSQDGMRIVIDVKRDGDVALVLNGLRRHTALRSNYSVNMTCLNSKRQPRLMGLLDVLGEFVEFRRDVIRRRTAFLMENERNSLERQMALYAVRTRVDEVIALIRGAADGDSARAALLALEFIPTGEFSVLLIEIDPDAPPTDVFKLTPAQVDLVLKMELRTLTARTQNLIAERAREILARIRGLLIILEDKTALDDLMRAEMREIRERFATPRLTVILDDLLEDITDDDLIEDKQVVLTLSRLGYIKVTPLASYREQSRGGKGKSGMDTKDNDVVAGTLVCTMRTNLLFFTDRGIAHVMKAWKLPEAAANARGRHISNFLKGMKTGESIATVMPMPAEAPTGEEGDVAVAGRSLVFVTDIGEVRRNSTTDFSKVNQGGKIAMKLEDDSGKALARLITVLELGEDEDVLLFTRKGKCVRFPLTELRVFNGRSSTGVKGVNLTAGDSVIGAATLRHSKASAAERGAYLAGGTSPAREAAEGEEATPPLTLSAESMAKLKSDEQFLLTVTTTGHGKRFSSYDLRTTARGAQGVSLGAFEKVAGEMVACFPVVETDGIVLVSDGGQVIRTRLSDVRVMGRTARGVRLFDLPDGEAIVDVARIGGDEEEAAPAV